METVLSLGESVRIQADKTKAFPADSPMLMPFKIQDSDEEPAGWVMSRETAHRKELEVDRLIKAKVRAIIGTAVFGAGLAIALGVIIAYTGAKGGLKK